MPTSQSSMRPSSTMSDENSDFEYDDDDDDDVEALDDGSGDEKSTEFIVPSIKRSNKEETQTEVVALLKTIDNRLNEMAQQRLQRPRTGSSPAFLQSLQ